MLISIEVGDGYLEVHYITVGILLLKVFKGRLISQK